MNDDTSTGSVDRPETALEARLAELEAAYGRRIAELEGTVADLTAALAGRAADAPTPHDLGERWAEHLRRPMHEPPAAGVVASASPGNERPTNGSANDGPTGFDRRRLLSRAGTAAVGAVIGGAAASIAAASPAAAASASFDTSTSTPAVDAVSTGTGPAVRARNDAAYSGGTAQPLALEADGFSRLNGPVVVGDSPFTSRTFLTAYAPDDIHWGISGYGKFTGVEGSSEGYGVFGYAQKGVGTVGYAPEGIGVMADGGRAGLAFTANSGSSAPPPTQAVAHGKGEVVFDQNRDLWLCTADGTPGTWVRLGGAGSAGALTVLPKPVRVYDSRVGAAPTDVGPKQPLQADTPRTIDPTKNTSGVPTDAVAATVSVTVTNTTGGTPSGPAFLSLYASGPWPGTSSLNWTAPGTTIAVTTVVALASGATLTAYASAKTDLILDVLGYYR